MRDEAADRQRRLRSTAKPGPDWRYHPGERLGVSLQRVMVSQLDWVIQALAGSDLDAAKAVHGARKTMKRLRGLLRLVRDAVGYDAYRSENVALRDAARKLAPVRDAVVMVETLDDLQRHAGGRVGHGAFSATRAMLVAARDDMNRAVSMKGGLQGEVLTGVEKSRGRIAAWSIDGEGPTDDRVVLPDDFASLSLGLDRVYRRGRKALRLAAGTPTPHARHIWRKRAKYLRYQLEYLEELRREVLSDTVRRLDDLGDTLGRDHDLWMLDTLLAEGGRFRPEEIRPASAQLQAELQERALRLGESLYIENPRAFVARIGGYWEAATR